MAKSAQHQQDESPAEPRGTFVVTVVAGAIVHDMWLFQGPMAIAYHDAALKFYELCGVNDRLWSRRTPRERQTSVKDGYYQIQTDRAICITYINDTGRLDTNPEA